MLDYISIGLKVCFLQLGASIIHVSEFVQMSLYIAMEMFIKLSIAIYHYLAFILKVNSQVVFFVCYLVDATRSDLESAI